MPSGGPDGLNTQAHAQHVQASICGVLFHTIRLDTDVSGSLHPVFCCEIFSMLFVN
jgi:hypothetical protein